MPLILAKFMMAQVVQLAKFGPILAARIKIFICLRACYERDTEKERSIWSDNELTLIPKLKAHPIKIPSGNPTM